MIEKSEYLIMEFVKFERMPKPYDFLDFKNASDTKMEIIGQFLDSDVHYRSDRFLEFLKLEVNFTGGNLTYVAKNKGTVAIMNSLTNEEVLLTEDQFFQIITQWALIYKPAPKELLIKKINDQFIFEPTYD